MWGGVHVEAAGRALQVVPRHVVRRHAPAVCAVLQRGRRRRRDEAVVGDGIGGGDRLVIDADSVAGDARTGAVVGDVPDQRGSAVGRRRPVGGRAQDGRCGRGRVDRPAVVGLVADVAGAVDRDDREGVLAVGEVCVADLRAAGLEVAIVERACEVVPRVGDDERGVAPAGQLIRSVVDLGRGRWLTVESEAVRLRAGRVAGAIECCDAPGV
jgi:hypothetical protein